MSRANARAKLRVDGEEEKFATGKTISCTSDLANGCAQCAEVVQSTARIGRVEVSDRLIVYFAPMYSREDASRIKHEFWTMFGRYMSPIPSAEGMKINWVNYHTKVKDVYFRMDAGKKSASISISMEHADPDLQELYFEQFLQMKDMLHTTLQEEWDWQLHVPLSDGKIVSRIYKEIPDVSVFNKDHWPDLISFFKPRMIALDRFWENAKWGF